MTRASRPTVCAHGEGLPQGPTCHRVELMATLDRWVPIAAEGRAIVAVLGGPRQTARLAYGVDPGAPMPPKSSELGRRLLSLYGQARRWATLPDVVTVTVPADRRGPGAATICALIAILTPAERAAYIDALQRWTL